MTTLEPLYTLKVAAELIPFVNAGALRDFLWKHRDQFPSKIMPIDRKFVRMLSHSEIITIRAMRLTLRVKDNPGTGTGRAGDAQKTPYFRSRASIAR
jgi:hypothetical protein